MHLNGDESMAFGAGFYAANNSRSFRVKPVWMKESFDFDILMGVHQT